MLQFGDGSHAVKVVAMTKFSACCNFPRQYRTQEDDEAVITRHERYSMSFFKT